MSRPRGSGERPPLRLRPLPPPPLVTGVPTGRLGSRGRSGTVRRAPSPSPSSSVRWSGARRAPRQAEPLRGTPLPSPSPPAALTGRRGRASPPRGWRRAAAAAARTAPPLSGYYGAARGGGGRRGTAGRAGRGLPRGPGPGLAAAPCRAGLQPPPPPLRAAASILRQCRPRLRDGRPRPAAAAAIPAPAPAPATGTATGTGGSSCRRGTAAPPPRLAPGEGCGSGERQGEGRGYTAAPSFFSDFIVIIVGCFTITLTAEGLCRNLPPVGSAVRGAPPAVRGSVYPLLSPAPLAL